jgi:hypothetical protein
MEETEIGVKKVTDRHPRKVSITGSNPYILVDKRRDRHSKNQLGARCRVAVDSDIWPCLFNLNDRLGSSLSEFHSSGT